MSHLPFRTRMLGLVAVAMLVAGAAACDSNPSNEGDPSAGPPSTDRPVESGRSPGSGEHAGIPPRVMADALFALMSADRNVYSNQVVYRLQDVEEVIKSSEDWHDRKSLPLPAQMFRMGAQLVARQTDTFSYSLLSKWPINKDNVPRTEVERTGLDSVAENSSKPAYGQETIRGVKHFTAVYADVAVSPACVTCHNAHPNSPRTDFKTGDVMGGVVIRIPLR